MASLWLVTVDKATMMADVVEATAYDTASGFALLATMITRFNRDRRSPADLAGPFWSRADAQRFVRLHHDKLRRFVSRSSRNPR